jgi:hypothetical protein
MRCLLVIVSTLSAMLGLSTASIAQDALDNLLPVRGFCIAAPSREELDPFVRFIEEELAPRRVNTLVLRVDYNFQYASHPDLGNRSGLSKEDAARLAKTCRDHGIALVPQLNLLGHQSWANHTGRLLQIHPEFDETPWVKMPEKYSWPNPDRLYCKSYCPRHPAVHAVVFALIDELCDAFEADSLHAGMDEVFYIGEDKCPRCGGRDKARLLADEVTLVRDHLHGQGRRMWMWGDRLLDGKTTGLGEWEASENGTHGAIDLIPKDVVICDWHYERPDPTAAYFAMKGFDVVTCPWKNEHVAVRQLHDTLEFRAGSTDEMKPRFRGVMQTVWSGTGGFLREFHVDRPTRQVDGDDDGETASQCFRTLYGKIIKLPTE